MLAYLYGPISVFIVANIILFLCTATLLYRFSSESSLVRRNHTRQRYVGLQLSIPFTARCKKKQFSFLSCRFRIIFSLFLLMGVSWMNELISFVAKGPSSVWIFTDVLNILTGVYVFIIFVCKPKVLKLLKKRLPFVEQVSERMHLAIRKTNTITNPNPYSREALEHQSSDSQPSNSHGSSSFSNPDYQRNISLETTDGGEMTPSTEVPIEEKDFPNNAQNPTDPDYHNKHSKLTKSFTQ